MPSLGIWVNVALPRKAPATLAMSVGGDRLVLVAVDHVDDDLPRLRVTDDGDVEVRNRRVEVVHPERLTQTEKRRQVLTLDKRSTA